MIAEYKKYTYTKSLNKQLGKVKTPKMLVTKTVFNAGKTF